MSMNIDAIKIGELNLASNTLAIVYDKGSIEFSTNVAKETNEIKLSQVLYVLGLRVNLLSISKITDRDLTVIFDRRKVRVVDENGNVKMVAIRKNDLYYVNEKSKYECRIAQSENEALKI